MKLPAHFKDNDYFLLDVVITVLLSVFWLFWGYQNGFYNSPDCWYRGVLAKSLLAGRPYFINLKQGWFYDFGPWHHDAAHSPFLPVLYALSFLLFGYKISAANIIVCLSVGLLAFPLLRISRRLFKTVFPAFLIYLLVVFNNSNEFLFEMFAGLSLPTTLMLFVFFLFFLLGVLETEKRGWLWGGIISLVSFYYIRPGEQVVFFWLFFSSLIIGFLFLSKAEFRRLGRMWLWSALLVAPWVLRKIILFKHPFFTHTTPALWTSRGYDYWTYHENMPYPTAAAYFSNHTIRDFLYKIFVQGAGNYYTILDKSLYGPAWLYLAIFAVSLLVVFFSVKGKLRFFYFTFANTFVVYSIIYSLVPVLDRRYMIPVYFLFAFTAVSAVFFLAKRFKFFEQRFGLRLAAYVMLFALIAIYQQGFWLDYFPKTVRFSFRTSDAFNRKDVLVQGLEKRQIDKNDFILGPFADVQRLSFATGLTFIEEPDNIKRLKDPVTFFKRYKIRYSLVDVSRLLPKEMIENTEIIGDRVLFTIKIDGSKTKKTEQLAQTINFKQVGAIKKSINLGIRKKIVYIDSYHSAEPTDFSIFRDIGVRTYVFRDDFVENKDKLFQSGLLIMRYGTGKNELSKEEEVIVEQFIVNGGRILLLCPAWVRVSYEKKGIQSLPHYRIAKKFGLLLSGQYVTAPMKIVHPGFKVKGIEQEIKGTFSSIIHEKAQPILIGREGEAAAVAAQQGDSRIIVWGQNNLLNGEFSLKPKGKEFIRRIFSWLLGK